MVLEKTPESPLDSKIKPVNLKGNQPWIVIGRTDAETEAPVLWSLDVKSQLIGKDCSAEKYWGQKEKRASEDEMAAQHHQCNEHELWEMVRNRETSRATFHRVTKSQTRLSDFTFTFHFHALEKEMATHSSVLAWRIPWTEEPGRLQSCLKELCS